ncbi:MAG: glycosyltransferase family 2 protein [Prevotella sp.]
MKVSILVPVYNVEKFFSRCLESLFSQTYSNIEYVFVNDCTPDNSMKVLHDILKKYPNHVDMVKIIEHPSNYGIAVVRNTLLDNAHGDYVLFVDSDDWIEIDMVEKLVGEAKRSGADVVGCNYYEDYPDGKVLRKQTYPSNHIEAMKAMTLLKIKGVLWKLLIRRELIAQNNLSFVPEIHFGEDYIFCCKLFYYAQAFSSVDKALYHYVQYNPNNYCSTDSDVRINSFANAIRMVETFYREKGVYDMLKLELLQRKFLCKSSYVLDSKHRNLRKWSLMFPESNGVWHNIGYSTPNKIKFLLSEVFAKLFC